MPNNISEEELQERVALLKRFKELLEKQRQKFRDYLNVLEKQAEVIKTENTEALLVHTEIEQQIVANISNLQKVIQPIEEMYLNAGLDSSDENYSEIIEIPTLKTDLAKLQKEVLEQNELNRSLLKTQMESLRQKIEGIKNPYRYNKSIYSKTEHTASIISIEG
jgi:hypothetical protein